MKLRTNSIAAHPWLFTAIAIGIALRLALAVISIGSNDATTWFDFATTINREGIWQLYHTEPLFNHPPLSGWLGAAIAYLAQLSGLSFYSLFKLPSIFADIAIIFLIHRIRGIEAATVYSLGLGSIIISGYHGNTDSLCVALALFAAAAYESRRAALIAGLLLGASLNIKIVPLLLIPAFIVRIAGDRRSVVAAGSPVAGRLLRDPLVRFVFGVALAMVPFLIGIDRGGADFVRHVLKYSPILEYWGIALFLLLNRGNYPQSAAAIDMWLDVFRYYGKYLILLVIMVCAAALRNTRMSLYSSCATSFALFLVLASGFGIQYLIYVLPFAALSSTLWGARLNLLSGVLSIALYSYFMEQWWPLYSFHDRTWPKPVAFLGACVWLALIAFVFDTIRAARTEQGLTTAAKSS